MKLYVWYEVRCDYTPGIAFALAESEKEAKELILKDAGFLSEHIKTELDIDKPIVYDSPMGFSMSGGG